MNNDNQEEPHEIVQELIASRNTSAAIKQELLLLRADYPDTLIFAFEGKEDKPVYYSWITRIAPALDYEPFTCLGKDRILQLIDSIERDKNDLANGIYFFVDRDFDELRGREQKKSIYITDTYSFENHLVNRDIVDNILKMEFHCDGKPNTRAKISALFEKVYKSFLNTTKDINFRIYCARKLQIPIDDKLPNRINQLCNLTIDDAQSIGMDAKCIIPLSIEPTGEKLDTLQAEFEKLEPSRHYRGKFSYLFLIKWLELLAKDRHAENSVYFFEVKSDVRRISQRPTLDSLAMKSCPPKSLRNFIESISSDQKQQEEELH